MGMVTTDFSDDKLKRCLRRNLCNSKAQDIDYYQQHICPSRRDPQLFFFSFQVLLILFFFFDSLLLSCLFSVHDLFCSVFFQLYSSSDSPTYVLIKHLEHQQDILSRDAVHCHSNSSLTGSQFWMHGDLCESA